MFIMLWRIFIYIAGYLIMTSAKLAISLKHNIIFPKFLDVLLNNCVTSSLTHIRWRSKNHLEVIWVYIFRFFIKNTISPNCFWKYTWKNSMRLGFRWSEKSIETIKLYNRSLCRFYSLCFYISMVMTIILNLYFF